MSIQTQTTTITTSKTIYGNISQDRQILSGTGNFKLADKDVNGDGDYTIPNKNKYFIGFTLV